MRRVKGWLAVLLLKAIRAYFSGRTVHWMTRLDGQPLHRAEGRVISGRIDRGPEKNPVGMTFFWLMPGRPIHEMKRFSLQAIERDKILGWVFFED